MKSNFKRSKFYRTEYTYGVNFCQTTDTKIIEVFDLGNILLTIHTLVIIKAGNDTNFCDADVIEYLNPVSPIGGTWLGVSIVNSDRNQ